MFRNSSSRKGNSGEQADDCPEEYVIHKTLFILCKGDAEKMEWFYMNKTKADLSLWVILYNTTQSII